MSPLIEIIDTYLLNYDKYDNGKVAFECEYGELVFYKNTQFLSLLEIYYYPQKERLRDLQLMRQLSITIANLSSGLFLLLN